MYPKNSYFNSFLFAKLFILLNSSLSSFENDSLVYCDIYAIKFITISTTGVYGTMNNFQNMGGTMNGGPMMRVPMMY